MFWAGFMIVMFAFISVVLVEADDVVSVFVVMFVSVVSRRLGSLFVVAVGFGVASIATLLVVISAALVDDEDVVSVFVFMLVLFCFLLGDNICRECVAGAGGMFGVCSVCCSVCLFGLVLHDIFELDIMVCCRCLSFVLLSLYFFIVLLGSAFLASSATRNAFIINVGFVFGAHINCACFCCLFGVHKNIVA